MSRVIRTLALPAAALLMIGSLGACSAPPAPNATAELLAGSLADLDLASVPLAGSDAATASAELAESLKPLESIPRTVTLASVTEDEGSDVPKTATAVYNTVWDVDASDTDWTYQTQATLELDNETKTWAVRYSPSMAVPGLESGQYVAKRNSPAKRGEILGNNAQTLVTDRPVLRIGINKEAIGETEWEDSATKLAKVLEIDAEPYAKRVAASGPRAFVQAITLRDDADRTVTDQQLKAIPGVLAQPDTQSLAPSRSFARAILGSVGEATAEIVADSKGSVASGDRVGLSGLQKAYQDELAGTRGYSINIYNQDKAEVSTLVTREAVDGKDLKTTLDRNLQEFAESLIADSDSDAALVAVRPSDGAILAAAAGPTDNAQNTALLGKYAPGSTFKVITALAMLRSGDTPTTSVDCPATMSVDGKAFKNYDGYPSSALGSIPLSEAVAQSCNTVFLEGASKVKAPALADAAASLGLNMSPATGAASFLGSVPEDSTGTELAANGIGQGVVQASALGMATVAASVQNGATVSPRLVVDPKPDAAAKPKNPLTAAEAKALSGMMAQVVDHGTLKDLKSVPGPAIIGKSGTAEYDAERNAHAWSIAAQGDLAVAVFVGDGSGGAQTAGPILAEFLADAQ
ncbi:penicillin-binding transpeptidase domain-containing protein [Paeniglutamicibacter sulfureus]|uniref:Cell division protein FtsI/penicillin-binding protein 2 n=1 Tax=Paeniglutamicibacter sulfureus TaxID=43666 RepID=A0ABU2BFU0_9MICC|nr:penicillin-binding transpeptidase domain-containing protein [Paeniglutamicibacter sulfureus]MDR7357146.1 cell division protein FtsI/penicillin-binding protein 2 [Paeniglutamicibacter sulfureus]